MSPERLKHLEFLQAVISRLASNSFLVKGWTVTLVAALFALAAKESHEIYAIIALVPAICFWLLDSYFLRQEKLFRRLFDEAASQQTPIRDFLMDPSEYEKTVPSILKIGLSGTILGFYVPVIVGILLAVASPNVISSRSVNSTTETKPNADQASSFNTGTPKASQQPPVRPSIPK